MSIVKIAAAIILGLLILFVGKELFSFWGKNRAAAGQYSKLQSEIETAQKDYDRLRADLDYYLIPANLEKELRARFNLRQIGEHMIIIVPGVSSSASSAQ